jgi:hypothetical protein
MGEYGWIQDVKKQVKRNPEGINKDSAGSRDPMSLFAFYRSRSFGL